MNIFVLDTDIKKCAEYHCDKHIVKMLLESVLTEQNKVVCTMIEAKKVIEYSFRFDMNYTASYDKDTYTFTFYIKAE